MNTTEVIAEISDNTGVTKKDTKIVLKGLISLIIEQTKKDKNVKLFGLGQFKKSERTARKGRNPSTGKPMVIPGSTSIRFKASSSVKSNI